MLDGDSKKINFNLEEEINLDYENQEYVNGIAELKKLWRKRLKLSALDGFASKKEINIEDDGTVRIYAIKKESLDRALEMVNNITAEIEIDKIYQGKVVSTTNFGAFMEVLPGQDGMIHISELADFRVEQVEDVVNVGDVIYAKCIGIDDKGRVKMSRQAALEERGEQHIDDALREKAQAKREERSNKGNDEDWSPSDGDKKNRRRNNRRRGDDRR